MTRVRGLFGILLALALPGCTGGRDPHLWPEQGPFARPTRQLPDQIGPFGLADSETVPYPNGGLRYGYHARGGIDVDVYLKPLAPQGQLCRTECRVQAAQFFSDLAKAQLDELAKHGLADSSRVIGEHDASTPYDSWLTKGRHLSFLTFIGGVASETHLYLFAGREELLMIRARIAPSSEAAARIGRFVSDLLPHVEPPYRCHGSLARTSGISMGVTVGKSRAEAALAVNTTLTALGYPLDYVSLEEGRFRSWPHRVGARRGGEPNVEEQAAVIVYGTVFPRHDSTGVEISSVALCDAGPGTMILEMTTALRVMGGVSQTLKVR
ncbi:MAG TPA: hypothetical protein VGI83_05925 [Gemmatimonadales bacterium]